MQQGQAGKNKIYKALKKAFCSALIEQVKARRAVGIPDTKGVSRIR